MSESAKDEACHPSPTPAGEFAKGLTMSRQPQAAMKKYAMARTTG